MNGYITNNKILFFFKRFSLIIKNKESRKNFLKLSLKFIKNKKIIPFFIKNGILNIIENEFNKSKYDKSILILKDIINKKIFNESSLYKITFINGKLINDLTIKGPWEINLFKKNINNIFLNKNNIEIDSFLKILQNTIENKFIINLPKNIKTKYPLHLINLNINNINNNKINTSNLYNLITIKENSKTSIIESYLNFSKKINLSIYNKKIDLYNNSSVDYYINYNDYTNFSYYFTKYFINLRENSKLKFNLFAINKGNINHNSYISIKKKKSKFKTNIFSYSKNNYHFIKSDLNYISSSSKSTHFYKSISKFNGINEFKSIIYIKKKIFNIFGNLYAHGLNIEKNSKTLIEPKLKIYSEDVDFKHGITVSNIDYNKIFYLQSRCISYKRSLNIIINSFSYDIINKIKNKNFKIYIYNLFLKKINKKNVSY